MKQKLISFVLIGTLVAGSLFSVSADEIEDLQAETEYNQQLLDDLNNSIDELEVQKAEVLGRIDEADTELVMTLATISTLNTQIELKSQQLSDTTKDLGDAQEEEAVEYAAMKRRIQYLYETGGDAGWATVLLNEMDISDMLNRAEYAQKIYEYDRQCLEHYASVVEEVSNLKAQYEQEKKDLELMLANQQEQQGHLEEQLAYLRETSSNYDEQLAGAAEAAAAYVEIINQQNSMIQELLAEQERQRQAAEAAAAAAAAAAEQAAAEAAAAEQAAAEAAAAEAAAAAEEAARAAAEANDEEARAAAEAAAAAAEEAQRQAEEAARAAEEEAQRAAEEAQRQAEEEAQRQAEEQAAEEQGGEEEVVDDGGSSDPDYYPETGNAIVDRAYAWVGRAEYVWGGCSPGAFDCSGFVSYCVTGAYARIGTTYTFLGFPQVSNPQPGDICTSATHCGIYVGGGMMVHASDYGVGVIVSEVRSDMIYVRY